jgi:hypothetical protein
VDRGLEGADLLRVEPAALAVIQEVLEQPEAPPRSRRRCGRR